jgi:hypothetical protein
VGPIARVSHGQGLGVTQAWPITYSISEDSIGAGKRPFLGIRPIEKTDQGDL